MMGLNLRQLQLASFLLSTRSQEQNPLSTTARTPSAKLSFTTAAFALSGVPP
jgi:hypothetical protein